MHLTSARLSIVLCLLVAALVPSPADGAKKDDGDRGIFWEHEWLPERLFDYRHKSWKSIREGELMALFLQNDVTYRYEANGSRIVRWEFELSVREPEAIHAQFHVTRKSPLTKTEVTKFDLSWTAAGVTRTFAQGDLFEQVYDPNGSYISGVSGLYVNLDLSNPGVLRGAIETRDAPHEGFEEFMGNTTLVQARLPSKERSIHIEVPTGTSMTFEERFFKLDDQPTLTTEDGFDRYTYRFETLWPPNHESDMPHSLDSYPSLSWSNQTSWEALSGLVDAAWEPEMAANGAMKAWAAELTDGAEDTHNKALAIHDAIADGWDYLGFYPGQSGWIPHAAEECYIARIGDCKDKTALMVTLMRTVGVDAHPALVNAGNSYELSFAPSPSFNHAIIWVEDADHRSGGFFLDSVDAGIGASPVRASLAGRQALVIDDVVGRLVSIPETPPERWLEVDETLITLADDGSGTAEVTWTSVGMAANKRAGDAARQEASKRERVWRTSLLSRYPGSEVLSLDEGPDPAAPHDTWRVHATLRLESVISIQGRHALFHPAWLRTRSPSSVAVDWGQRTHPVMLEGLNQVSRIRLRLPPNLRVLALPQPGGEERDNWRSSLVATQEGDEVVLELSVQEDPGPMDKGLQEARRNFVKATGDLQKRVLVLEVSP